MAGVVRDRAHRMFLTGKSPAARGIVASNGTAYTLSALQCIVKTHTGAVPD